MKKLTIPEVTNDIREIISPHTDIIKTIGIFGSLARGDLALTKREQVFKD